MGEAPARIRTYHARRGRLRPAHHAALSTLLVEWSLDASGDPIDPMRVFGREADLVLEIGCGMGDSTRVQALREPERDVIAVDVHTRGIATLLRGIEHDGISNVRVVMGDAVRFVEERLRPASLAGARIYFPDPWPKARHAKRRLVQPAFVAMLFDRLRPGAFIHCATDSPSYAEQMREGFSAHSGLSVHPALPNNVFRPVTKYERRARRLGHPVEDVWVTRTLSP
ncbi:MAG TPA: tRNA (guanosine(46)-N7)-methyltransferase TrmB [Actinomycetes bacterium]|nr:tRNA (guanosine(46)-N7)-methyltransferase TrmB [Actinomycetes bacterium]